MSVFNIRKAAKADIDLLADFAHQLNLYHGDSGKPDPDHLREGWGRFDAYLELRNSTVMISGAGELAQTRPLNIGIA